jgi:tetratricopeptide (TPR) repeat protein
MKLFLSRFIAALLSVLALAWTSFAARAENDLLSSGHVSEAVVVLSNHKDAQSLNLLSRAYYAMECWDDAVKYGERAVQLEPNNSFYHLWLGRAYGRKAADSKALTAASNAKKTKSEFERAVQLDGSNVAARLDLAQYYTEAPGFMGGGVDKAHDQAVEVGKYDAGKAHLVLARIAVKQKQYAEAETQFRAAIKQAGNPADMWLQFANFYRQQGRLDDMEAAVHSAVAQPNKPAEAYFDAALELYQGGRDYAAAVQYLQKYLASGELVESAPAFRAHYLIGQLQQKMGQSSAAIVEYQASLKMASGFAPARLALDHVQ